MKKQDLAALAVIAALYAALPLVSAVLALLEDMLGG